MLGSEDGVEKGTDEVACTPWSMLEKAHSRLARKVFRPRQHLDERWAVIVFPHGTTIVRSDAGSVERNAPRDVQPDSKT